VADVLCTLWDFVKDAEGAKTVVLADFLDGVTELLASPSWEVRSYTCAVLSRIAEHDGMLERFFAANICTQLVSAFRRVSFPTFEVDADDPAAIASGITSWRSYGYPPLRIPSLPRQGP
jgi:hypothetical protein